jgi:hypothetical protein|tara:strand:+ start:120 stop:263 length:144 start_codon:yes stop_codon:yes gene_type:complete
MKQNIAGKKVGVDAADDVVVVVVETDVNIPRLHGINAKKHFRKGMFV